MGELTLALPGTTPAQWWEVEVEDVLTVVALLEERAP